MSQNLLPLQRLCDGAMQAAQDAGEFIRRSTHCTINAGFKESGSSDASQIVTEVDIRSEAIIRQHLQSMSRQWDIAFVGEETTHASSGIAGEGVTPERLIKPYFWCVDPLDGTLAFVEGRAGYAVSIALVEQSGHPLIGVVYDPVESTMMHAVSGKGAYRNRVEFNANHLALNSGEPLMVFADSSFAEHEQYDDAISALEACAQRLGLDGCRLVNGNGAVKNACHVLGSKAACYLKLPKTQAGGGSIWDYSATACIASEAGAWVSNIHGQALELNRRASTFMNHQGVIYASNQLIGRTLVDAL